MNHPVHGFGSDNHSGVHPKILKALNSSNEGHLPSYGTDPYSLKATKCFKKHFSDDAQVFFVFNGTAANTLALKTLTKPHQSIICSSQSHLNIDECGAPESLIGCKLITIESNDGKITKEQIEKKLIRLGDQHFSQPKVISITQPTELGTVYTVNEIQAISDFAHKNNLYLHIDGARLSNACRTLKCSFAEMICDTNVDALSFGGTKNGLMFGEAVIFFPSNLARKGGELLIKDFKYIRKQGLNLPSKSRFIATQFIEYWKNDLWKEIADHSLFMAKKLLDTVANIEQIEISQKVESNAVFAKIPKNWLKPLREDHFFYVWNSQLEEQTPQKRIEVRWITTFDTTIEDIESFSQSLQQCLKTDLSQNRS